MPRDIPVGNGSLLIAFDVDYNIRDLYYPRVGKENQTLGYPNRFGVWTHEGFSWVNAKEWKIVAGYVKETLVTDTRALNERLGIQLACNDVVDFEKNIYVRKVIVRNLKNYEREVRLFFHQDLSVMENEIGDTVFYDAKLNCLIHYKGPRYFLINCSAGDVWGVREYATGIKRLRGAEGTWRDAEDGILGGNPIAQGSVDSTIGIELTIPPHEESVAYYWIAAGRNYGEVDSLNDILLHDKPQKIIDRTACYWQYWVNKEEFNFGNLPADVVNLFKRSLLVLMTQIDSGGAIIAANDSDIKQFAKDTYSYMWPRDGALVAYALMKAGYTTTCRNFFNFCANTITPYNFCASVMVEDGFLLHKYNPDGSFGSSWHPWVKGEEIHVPIQEDETALILWAMGRYYDLYRRTDEIRPLYHGFIEKAADFLVSYRDEQTGLPLPSYDLWEERRGILSFTAATVYGGLLAAANLSDIFYHTEKALLYRQTAMQIKKAIDQYLYSEKHQRFLRMIYPKKDGGYEIDATIDASLYGMFAFGVYAPDDIKVQNTMKAIEDTLWVKTKIGGIARYERDFYQRVGSDDTIPGNPWIICTMWLAQYYVAIAKSIEDLERVVNYLRWTVSRALPSGVLAEQINPFTGEPISVSPLTWSHAMVVQTVMDYLEKLQELHTCGRCGRSIFHYDRAGRQQIKKHSLTYSGIIPEQKSIHYLDQANIKKDDTLTTVSIDPTRCVGCGICVENAKGVMDLVEDKAKIIAGKATSWNIPPGFEKCCPMDAITVENTKRG
ncbi:Glucoamylase precursor [Candidatus Brocadiaceae bacterium B188]|nr:glycoside hydrolase family 15 protein [Candidatus Brocadia sapporoensis]OQZ04318.1 MAG: glycoside hydrolase family 15 [Candidatus Brocadia sp. UTAMX1]QQR66093.1 MAG: glycoside hydrolase family 15 protein [Candidatus Brocadia sp.]RZV57701.1 MAG: glycoside hydrolase family 15 protein [Candidatus Brocadia sp. BROELEC01]TWU53011.1 Glucoamylase precursor [Candidatus Brocadiaceae bacterium B188]